MSKLTKEEIQKIKDETKRYKEAIVKLQEEYEIREKHEIREKNDEIENHDDYFLNYECCWLMDNVTDLRNKNAKTIDEAICDIMIHLSNVRKYIKGEQ